MPTLALIAALLAGTFGLALAPAPAMAQAAACAAFDAWEWAQSVYESDPVAYAALDPDGNGRACEALPNGAAPALWTDEVPADAEPATLVDVVDGDTIDVALPDGTVDRVRLILVNTPETVDPRRPVECFGAEASAFTAWLLSLGADLYLERAVSERDRFDRLLRSVWLDFGDGEVYLLNEAIVRSGYGERSTFPPDVGYVDQIRDAQAFAREHQLGLWGGCGEVGVPAAPAPADPAPQPAPAPAPARSGNCDPSYPGVCIPPSPPDLDCGQIAPRRFQVLPPDPHGFDGDGDGVGCESG